MNAGIIAARYAKAFLEYIREEGSGDKVYPQTVELVRAMNEVPQLKDYITDTLDISLNQKLSLLSAALQRPLDPSISRFLKLVTDQRRLEYFPRMLLSFVEQYRAANNIKVGTLTTASMQEGLRQRLEKDLSRKTGSEVILHETTDESLIGGFVLELDGMRADGSVADQFRRIRNELVENNNRII